MATCMTKRPVNILLVEDNPGDVRLAREALKEASIFGQLDVVRDGREALDFLRGHGSFREAHCPDLILLDINMPRMNGLEFLASIKNDAILRRIPTVVLSTSRAEEDISEAYDRHVNCYVTKPADIEQFIEFLRIIGQFWCGVVTLPNHMVS